MVLKLRDRILKGPGGVKRPLTSAEMEALARSVDLNALDLAGYCRFQDECYARNTVLLNGQCELVVICWEPGQMSAVHDHGSSYCLYLVIEGTMLEERYRLRDGKPEKTDERSFGRGDITIAAGDSVHRINNRTDKRLVTVHIYSPPLGANMKLYTPIPRKAKAEGRRGGRGAMRVALIAGARPQFVKAAALLPALRARHEVLFIHTGQHFDRRMVEAHFKGLDLPPPEHRLYLRSHERAPRLAEMVAGLTNLLEEHPVDRVLALGDADSAVAAAVAGSFREIPVGHVEAGARSGERDLPEERNRILVDEASSVFFCSTAAHARNLEGHDGVHVTGDVMADVLLARKDKLPRERGEYGVLTLHRAGTADNPGAVARVLDAVGTAGCRVFFPRHPRTRVDRLPPNVGEMPPLPYLDFMGLVSGAKFAMTDSGGLQKEAYLLRVPCITMRDATEWGETVDCGWNVLTGTDEARIAAALHSLPRGKKHPPLYGDGHAAERIAELL